jgi:hypothetical protein
LVCEAILNIAIINYVPCKFDSAICVDQHLNCLSYFATARHRDRLEGLHAGG